MFFARTEIAGKRYALVGQVRCIFTVLLIPETLESKFIFSDCERGIIVDNVDWKGGGHQHDATASFAVHYGARSSYLKEAVRPAAPLPTQAAAMVLYTTWTYVHPDHVDQIRSRHLLPPLSMAQG